MTSRLVLAAYLADAVLHLVASAMGSGWGGDLTQALAMPLALAYFLVVVRSYAANGRLHDGAMARRLLRVMPVALFFSWLGDTLPRFFSGDAAFLVMVGGFLVAQVCYIAAFAPYLPLSVLGRRHWSLTAYVVLFAALVVTCLPGARSLAPAVVIYGITLVTMAILATGLGPLSWAGGALFFVSDGLIALGAFASFWPLHDPQQSLAVMSTYLAAQLLLVLGVLRMLRRGGAVIHS